MIALACPLRGILAGARYSITNVQWQEIPMRSAGPNVQLFLNYGADE